MLKVDPNDLFMKIVWFTITSVCIFAATQLRSLSLNVADLNIKMAIMVQSVSSIDPAVKDHEIRLRDTEKTLSEHGTRLNILERNK